MRRHPPYIFQILIFGLLFLMLGSLRADAANTYTVALDNTTVTDTYVTMRQTTDQMAFKVTNTGNSLAITSVKFIFVNGIYDTRNTSGAPSGWSVAVTNSGSESSITFTASSGSIPVGGSLTFSITLKGDGSASIQTAAADATDTLSSMTVANGGNTFTLGGSFPTWLRYGMLISSLTPSPTSVGAGVSTTYTLSVTNVSSATQNNIAPGTMTQTSGTGAVTYVSGPTPATRNLNANANNSFTYVYSGANGGTVVMSNTVGNGTVTAPSFDGTSLTVNTLSSTIAVDTTTIPSGYSVVVTLTVTNGGTLAATTVTPGTITTGGTATKTLISGPSPSSVASLPAGSTVSFVYQYMITGTNGQTYTFTNNATADGGQSTTGTTTTSGSIGLVYATVTPIYVGRGSTNTALDFQCYNTTGLTVSAIRIRAANASFVAASGTSTDALLSGWTTSISTTDVTFTSPGTSSNLASGKNGTLRVTYSSFPSPASDTSYTYSLRFTKSDGNTTTFAGPAFSVTLDKITLAKSPDKNLISQNNGTVDITATVTNNGSPVNAVAVTFSTSDGKLSSTSVSTNASGLATTTLTAPTTPTDIEATVTATIGSAVETTTIYIDGTNAESSTTVREKY